MCGRMQRLELDHIIPLSQGGENTLSNLEILCQDCHRIKTRLERAKAKPLNPLGIKMHGINPKEIFFVNQSVKREKSYNEYQKWDWSREVEFLRRASNRNVPKGI